MHRKNAEIAEDEVDASDIAAIRYARECACCTALQRLITYSGHWTLKCIAMAPVLRRDNFVQGETNFKQDMASIKEKAEEQGTAQPELKSTAHDIKKVDQKTFTVERDTLTDTLVSCILCTADGNQQMMCIAMSRILSGPGRALMHDNSFERGCKHSSVAQALLLQDCQSQALNLCMQNALLTCMS